MIPYGHRNTTNYMTGNHFFALISRRRGESEHNTHNENSFVIAIRSFWYHLFHLISLSALLCVHVRFDVRKQPCVLLGYPGTCTTRVYVPE